MTFMICAGEASGDLHASELISALRKQDSAAEFVFLGGDMMAEASGTKPAVHYRDMAFMGVADVLRNLSKVRNNLAVAEKLLLDSRPDALILIDYPSFNLRLAKLAYRHSIPTYYYISPKVWAWKEYRTAQIAKYCRRVLSIFPFEPDFYAKHGYERCSYVGNPSVEEIDRKLAAAASASDFRKKHNLDNDKPIIAIVPGSRLGEIERNMPIMLEAAKSVEADYQIVIAGAPGVDSQTYSATSKPVLFNSTMELMYHSTAALVTSGTASLEAALAGVPQVVCYRHRSSRLTYAVMSRLLKIPYVTLPNLIARQQVVPELLMHKCTVSSVEAHLHTILPDQPGRNEQLRGYELIRQKLGTTKAAGTAADLILTDLRKA